MMMSTSPASTWATNSAALAGDHRVSLVTIAVRASGKRSFTSSATRSTPGPQATRLSSSSHSGQSRGGGRSEEHTSELQSLMRISYAVFCLKKKNKAEENTNNKV